MPTDKFGNHAMNPALLRQRTAASQAAQGSQQQAPEPGAPPAVDQLPQTITITAAGGEITVQCDDSQGMEPQKFSSVEDALDYVKQELGESPQDESLEIPEAGAGDDAGPNGEPRSPSGLSA